MNVLNCPYYVNSTVYFIEGIFKLGTVWDTLGRFGTKYGVIIVLSKKAKALAAHPPAFFFAQIQKGGDFHVMLHLPHKRNDSPFPRTGPRLVTNVKSAPIDPLFPSSLPITSANRSHFEVGEQKYFHSLGKVSNEV